MAPLSEHEEADPDDLIDLARWLARQTSAFEAQDLNIEELAVARALIGLHGTYYAGSVDRVVDRRQQMLRVLGIQE